MNIWLDMTTDAKRKGILTDSILVYATEIKAAADLVETNFEKIKRENS